MIEGDAGGVKAGDASETKALEDPAGALSLERTACGVQGARSEAGCDGFQD